MDIKELEKFDPTVAELNAMVEKTKGISATDLTDKSQLSIVKEVRIELKNARVKIQKRGKELRADAVDFQKAVIAKEKELIGIIEPEELRLSDIEDQAKDLEVKRIRQEQLPERKERLSKIGDGFDVGDDSLLAMDSVLFEVYYNKRVADKNVFDRSELETVQFAEAEKLRKEQAVKDAELKAREDKVRDDERRMEAEKMATARAEAARLEERERLEQIEKEREVREDQARKAKELKEKEEAEKLDASQKYQKFLKENGYTESNADDFKEEKTSDKVILWKKVAVFKF